MPAVLRLLDRLHRRLLIHRRPLAALCVAAAVLLTTAALRPPDPATALLWTAARDLPGGSVLTTEDLRRTAFAPGSVPAAAARDLADLVGRTLTTPLGRGEVATSTRLVGNDVTAGHPGLAAIPLRIPDPEVVGMLRVGDRVDVVASDPQGRRPPERLLSEAPVLAVPAAPESSFGPGLSGRLVLVGVPEEAAVRVAEAASALYLTVIWTR